MLEHDNCIPYLSKSKACKTHKADAELKKLQVLDIIILNRKKEKKDQQESSCKQREEEMLRMEERTKPLFEELKQEKEK